MNYETLIGGDLSHHNWGKVNPAFWSFVILKATEGATYTDECLTKWLRLIKDTCNINNYPFVPFIGAYHFARPENNTFRTEVDHYLKTIDAHIGNCLCVLDWEDKALQVQGGEIWALQWLREVKRQTGSTPLFYCQQSAIKKYPSIVAEFPIWVAHYHTQDKHDDCGKYAMWQITSNPFDIDIFNGGKIEMAKLIQGI